ncbi:MAG: UDP-3-O-(3-hydroxymyristoyl)glucosamine N-acyltransferase [Candidatus Aminicenantes bacterium]|nr:UDP-3-O-(3-hydroxymyristoyl)glucosamine N-acyltransferase [Candidatus Aminicenantes bacterium]
MNIKLKYLAKKLDGKLFGNGEILIKGFRSINEPKKNYISFYNEFIPEEKLIGKRNKDISLLTNIPIEGFHCIVVDERSLNEKTEELLKYFEIKEKFNKGIHPTAIIGKKIRLGKDVSIGAHTTVGDFVKVGDNTIIYPNVVVYPKVKIGNNCKIHSGVVLRGGVELGDNVEIDANASIGTTGFERGFTKDKLDILPLNAGVKIKKNVFIGANSIICKGTTLETIVGNGSKIDGMVYIAHGVKIGKFCRIAGQSGISGKSFIDNEVSIGGQVGIDDNIYIGKKAFIASRSGVIKKVGKNEIVAGFPSLERNKWKKIQVIIRKLPEIWEKIKKVESKL